MTARLSRARDGWGRHNGGAPRRVKADAGHEGPAGAFTSGDAVQPSAAGGRVETRVMFVSRRFAEVRERWGLPLAAAGLAALALGAVVNAVLLAQYAVWAAAGLGRNDWSLFASLDPRAPYAGGWFKWAPPAAWVWAAVVPLGFGIWTALHLAVPVLLRDWRAATLLLVAAPFWHDVASGNILSFVLLAAWWAVRGSRVGIVAFCALAALVPRPIMIPALAWLLWREPLARRAFAVAALVVASSAVMTGWAGAWAANLLSAPGVEAAAPWNLSPSREIGYAWVFVAWPLSALAWRRGWLGVSSVLASPYWIPYYLVMLVLDVGRPARQAAAWSGRAVSRPGRG